MRKFSVVSLTALTAMMMAGGPAMTSQAAFYSFQVPAGLSGSGDCLSGSNLGNSGFGSFYNLSGGIFNGSGCVNNSGCTNGFMNGGNCAGNSGCLNDGNCAGNSDCFNGGGNDCLINGGGIILPDVPSDNEQPDGGNLAPDSSEYASAVLDLVNEERAKAGVSPVRLDTRAGEAANVRAQEIRQSFSHTRPNGSGFETALREAGITYRASGENIAYGQSSPVAVMNAWMNSAGHKANILNPEYSAMGIGHVNVGGVDYWTQLFFN